MDDWQLLKQYATGHSEEAFRTLVERYAGMVYQAALRQTGDPHAAEEIAQVVFIALAQKAVRIPRQATLYGWLFRATRFAVLNHVRQTSNRQRNEQVVVAMQSISESSETDSFWERITPHLNDALDKLSAADRELMMIRYFGNKSHRELADVLGITEETARKRMSRAIDRLRTIFARRGIVVSTIALAAAFAAHGAQAVPVEVAESCARMAVANGAAGAGVGSSGGLLPVFTGMKSSLFFSALAGLVVVGGAAFIIFKSSASKPPPAFIISTQATTLSASLVHAPSPPNPNEDTDSNTLIAAALDKVKAALHDPQPTTNYPNSVIGEAIKELGRKKRAAVPILQSALNDADIQVRLRAIDGLGAVGPDARETAPLLLGILRAGGFGKNNRIMYKSEFGDTHIGITLGMDANNVILFTLGQIRPSPAILPELAQIVQDSPEACKIVYSASTGNSPGINWLLDISDDNPKALNDAFRPLLKNADPPVRRAAASCLISSLGNAADAAVFPPVIEMLNSGDDNSVRFHGLIFLEHAARVQSRGRMAWLGPGDKSDLTAPRLGPYLNNTVLALTDVAFHSTREDLRSFASRVLAALSPDFHKYYPTLVASVENDDEMAVFISRVGSNMETMPEIREGLKRFPKAAPHIAVMLAQQNAAHIMLQQPRPEQEMLPALQEALTALAPSPDASPADRAAAVRARAQVVNAMQKIARDLPKPIFTADDVSALNRILLDPISRNDPERRGKISAARKLAQWPTHFPCEVSPNEIRRLLAAVKDADATTYDALVAKVKEIDPHFFDARVEGEKND